MRLQLALDDIDINSAIELVSKLYSYIDIIEAGTPLIKRYGVCCIRTIKDKFPDKYVVADMKTMDGGELEASLAFEAGADMMNVLACASQETILQTLNYANKYNKHIAADLIGVVDKASTAKNLARLGVHYIGIHTGVDEQAAGKTLLEDLIAISRSVNIPIIVAGGISIDTISEIRKYNPEIIIVGSTITKSNNPEISAKLIHDCIKHGS
jgi:3-hexulose-6-phosphate synthase